MKEFLKQIRLIDYLTTEIEIPKREFMSRLRGQVDPGSTGFGSAFTDIFSSSKQEYSGEVSEDWFKIKKKRKMFDTNWNMAVAHGLCVQRDNVLVIQTEINGFTSMMIPFYAIASLIYIFAIVMMFSTADAGAITGIAIPFLLVHAALMFGIPYFMMRRSVARMKYDLEREYFFIARK